MNQTTGDIAARLGGALIGDPSAPIHGAGTLQDGQPGEIGFLSEPHYRKYLADTALTAVLLAEPCPESRATQIIVADVKRAWRELAASFAPPLPPPAISPQAHIDPSATIGANVAIGAGAVIGAGADIGDGCRIEPLAYIAPGVQVIDTPDFPKEIYDGANAARELLTELRGRNDLNWAFISPPICLGADGGHSEDRTGKYRLGQDDALMDGDAPAGISVADLAIAIADDVEQKAHLHQRFTVASV